jgi:hypothetical protein
VNKVANVISSFEKIQQAQDKNRRVERIPHDDTV